ncbi:hypothetical protein C9374_000501 [Naegleria lovaniensis]|uniref:Uncharacterized protein n=1 Tax=Naegleria lovaniensis TaxID=51637 RepID=A0AA88GWJ1_NAELO|nr:uncharacterized protein C9374_000501 [Naegleria lovaniensis]KAG2388337.1 hypothetical protein C9374_000501 [Naegleria lovaniensis]
MNFNHRKRHVLQGGAKRKLPPSEDDLIFEDSGISDSEFIKGSKGSSSFSKSLPLRAIRPSRRKNESRDAIDPIPEDLKHMFSPNKSKDAPHLSLKQTFNKKQGNGVFQNQMRYDSNRSPLRVFEPNLQEHLEYSEDNIFMPNSNQLSEHEHFFIQPSPNLHPQNKFFFDSYNSKDQLLVPQFHQPKHFSAGMEDHARRETEETNYGDLTIQFKPEMTTSGSFHMFSPFNDESSTSSNHWFSFQSNPRDECDLFSPLKHRRRTGNESQSLNQEWKPLFGVKSNEDH